MSRLGQVLIEQGVLTAEEVDRILSAQAASGEPFGLLCERLLGVEPTVIETAWARQYATITRFVDPEQEAFDEHASDLVTRRQAWQFRIMPIRFDGDDLMVATTETHLRRALGFATNVIGVPVYFVLCEARQLGEALCRRYPLPGMTPAAVMNGVETLVKRF